MSQGPPLRVPLIADPENRGLTSDKDASLVNGYIEKAPNGELWCYKRPGYHLIKTIAAGQLGFGLTFYNGLIYCVFGNKFYSYNSLIDVITTIGTVTVQEYDFEPFLGALPGLFIHGTSEAYTLGGIPGVFTQVTDADYPVNTVPGCVYIDGTTYVMTIDAHIQGSALNDPTSWDPLNSILAQIEPDAGVAIAKQLNYLIAFKEYSVEVFYDAANAAGSPLGRIEAAKLSKGCAAAYSIINIDGDLFWITRSKKGGYGVSRLASLKEETISTPGVEKLLQSVDMTRVRGFALHLGGHKFYCLSCFNNENSLATYVYDLGEKTWYSWKDPGGGALQMVRGTSDGVAPVLQVRVTGEIYTCGIEYYQDHDGLIQFDLITPEWDGGSRFGKMVNLMDIAADQVTGSNLQCRVSDDNYQTWSNWRTFDLGAIRPMLDEWGTFYKRAHHFRHEQNLPLRLKAVDLHVDLGTL